MLPPKLHRVVGAWEIRCDTAGERRRCALLYRMPLAGAQLIDAGQSELIVHFVIDMVAGRESVLWRMFVPGMAGAPKRPELVAVGLSASQLREARGQLRYQLGAKEFVEGFPACGAAGCLMEAQVQRASAVVSRLWEGKAIELQLQIADGEGVLITLPGRGFRAAFGELSRLRRDELRSSSRR